MLSPKWFRVKGLGVRVNVVWSFGLRVGAVREEKERESSKIKSKRKPKTQTWNPKPTRIMYPFPKLLQAQTLNS